MELRRERMRLPFATITSKSPLSKMQYLLALLEVMKYQVGVRWVLIFSMGRGDSSALVGYPPKDRVPINTPVVVSRKIHYLLVNVIPY